MSRAQSFSFQYSLQAPGAEVELESSVGCQTMEATQMKPAWVSRTSESEHGLLTRRPGGPGGPSLPSGPIEPFKRRKRKRRENVKCGVPQHGICSASHSQWTGTCHGIQTGNYIWSEGKQRFMILNLSKTYRWIWAYKQEDTGDVAHTTEEHSRKGIVNSVVYMEHTEKKHLKPKCLTPKSVPILFILFPP